MAGAQSGESEHRRALRDLRGQGQSALTWGLPNPVTESVIVGIGILLRDCLADAAEEGRASKAAALAGAVLEKTIARMPQADSFACRKGCSFCCHSTVAVSAPEVFRIAQFVSQAGGPDRSHLLAACKSGSGASVEEVLGRSDPCPLLIESACSVHEVRPLACRQYVSVSSEACEAALLGKRESYPFVPGATNAGVMIRSLLLGAAESLGRPAEIYDLASALAIVLEMPDAEARWLAGADVLADAVKLPKAPKMTESVERWASMLKTLVEGT